MSLSWLEFAVLIELSWGISGFFKACSILMSDRFINKPSSLASKISPSISPSSMASRMASSSFCKTSFFSFRVEVSF